ncbi:MAG: 2-dehydro-3-deoxygalactonokinase [Clostridia bacterium]|nr:2-dehydro-3-deoxygalactonokinase [Clostridia bacterium]
MANYITVDGGTTNTRLSLVLDGKVVDTIKYNVGARVGIEDKSALKNAVKDGICTLLSRNGLKETDVKMIIASGMITSEFGLCNLPHLTAPIGIKELHNAMYETNFSDISPIPFTFIRGVKLQGKSLENADMMRGEETELFGLSNDLSDVYILPGSHSKIINITDKQIANFKTELTGEMIYALSQDTILKSSVDLSVDEISHEYLLNGYHYCNEHGINEALFKVRVLGNLFSADKVQIYSFFMGIVLCNEINTVLKLQPQKITVGGKSEIKLATVMLLKALSQAEIIEVDGQTVDCSSSLGAVKIFEYNSIN